METQAALRSVTRVVPDTPSVALAESCCSSSRRPRKCRIQPPARAMPNDASWDIEPTTTFYIAVADPVELWGRFLAYFESDGNYVVTGVKDARASAKVWMQGDASRDGFVAKIKLYSVHRTLSVYAVEWQRRSGCSLSSHEAFDRFKARFAMPVL